MKNKVIIFGISEFGRIASIYLSKDSPYEVAAFTANERYIKEAELLGKKVVPFEGIEEIYPPEEYSMLVAVGYSRLNKARAAIYDTCKEKGYQLISYINSKAIHWGEIEIGDNCFIFESIIQPFVRIGNDVIIWSGNHIGHDTSIGDHCFIAPHAAISGNVKIGPYCFIGINATVRDGITIAPECVIGAGTVILHDTIEKGVYKSKPTEPAPYDSSQLKRL